jgi:hypothetical protein|tara:strand:- start:628 stop:1155 length:528 start_codon:yes stop_codon:yes gene_type:complete
MTSKTPKTLEELTTLRDSLVVDVEAKQQGIVDAKYAIDFEGTENVSRVMKYVDKNSKWTIKDAALIINLYDNLKLEKSRINSEVSAETEDNSVMLGAIDLNTLYKSLTTVEGTGISSARNFITLLTNVGSQISTAMQAMGDSNKEIQMIHVELAELDSKIEELSAEKVEADEVIE